jgi:diguanylate cyclase (GGDEF)-like protein
MAKKKIPLKKYTFLFVSLFTCVPVVLVFFWFQVKINVFEQTAFTFNDFLVITTILSLNILLAKRLAGFLGLTIQSFIDAVSNISQRHHKIPLDNFNTLEFYQLADSFNSLSDQVEKQKRQLKRQQEHDKTLLLQRVADNLPGMIFQSKQTSSGSILTYFLSLGLEHIYANADKNQEQRVHELIDSFSLRDFPELLKTMRKSAQEMQPYHFDIEVNNLKGETYWLSISGQPSLKEDEVHWDGVALDITERKNHEKEMWQQAHIDAITHLNNRSSFNKTLLKRCSKEKQTPFSLLFFDLDNFKNINDKYGHHIGDQVLIKFAEQLKEVFSQLNASFLARVGGDEFCVIASNKKDLIKQTERLLNNLSYPIDIQGIKLYTHVSIGMASYPDNGHSAEAILHKADIAMYTSKDAGGHQLRQ